MAGTTQISTCNQSQESLKASILTQTMLQLKLPVFLQVSQMTESSRRAWTTLNTTVKTTGPHNTSQAKSLSYQAFKARVELAMADLHLLKLHLCMNNMRAHNSKLICTIAETTVKAWAELLVDSEVITDIKVSVKQLDLLDMRAKKTFIDQLTTTKKAVNRANKAEAHAPNTCKSLLQSLQFYRTQKDNLKNTLKTFTEACKLFTDKEEPLKSNMTFSQTIRFQWQCLTKRILKSSSQDTGYINKEPEKCLHCTRGLCEPKSWKAKT